MALNKIADQLEFARKTPETVCTGAFTRTMGLPCRHTLRAMKEEGRELQLNDVDAHWHFQRQAAAASAPETPGSQPDPPLRDPETLPQVRRSYVNRPYRAPVGSGATGNRQEPSSFELVEAGSQVPSLPSGVVVVPCSQPPQACMPAPGPSSMPRPALESSQPAPGPSFMPRPAPESSQTAPEPFWAAPEPSPPPQDLPSTSELLQTAPGPSSMLRPAPESSQTAPEASSMPRPATEPQFRFPPRPRAPQKPTKRQLAAEKRKKEAEEEQARKERRWREHRREKKRAADKEREKREAEEQDDQYMAYEDALIAKWADAEDPREAQLLAGIEGGAGFNRSHRLLVRDLELHRQWKTDNPEAWRQQAEAMR